jgi:hypothetical protein
VRPFPAEALRAAAKGATRIVVSESAINRLAKLLNAKAFEIGHGLA